MTKKTLRIKAYLNELTKLELLKLAKKKKAKIPKSWTKTKIIQTLSTIVTSRDLSKSLPSKPKTKTKKKLTPKKIHKPENLKDRVTKIFEKKGYQCTKNIQTKDIKLNIVGFKKGGLFSSDEHIIVECKEKTKVTQKDLKKFLGNTILYLRRKNIDPECVKAYIYTTGQFEKDVKTQAKKFSIIKLRRLKTNKKPR
jgi:hypothetical protein